MHEKDDLANETQSNYLNILGKLRKSKLESSLNPKIVNFEVSKKIPKKLEKRAIEIQRSIAISPFFSINVLCITINDNQYIALEHIPKSSNEDRSAINTQLKIMFIVHPEAGLEFTDYTTPYDEIQIKDVILTNSQTADEGKMRGVNLLSLIPNEPNSFRIRYMIRKYWPDSLDENEALWSPFGIDLGERKINLGPVFNIKTLFATSHELGHGWAEALGVVSTSGTEVDVLAKDKKIIQEFRKYVTDVLFHERIASLYGKTILHKLLTLIGENTRLSTIELNNLGFSSYDKKFLRFVLEATEKIGIDSSPFIVSKKNKTKEAIKNAKELISKIDHFMDETVKLQLKLKEKIMITEEPYYEDSEEPIGTTHTTKSENLEIINSIKTQDGEEGKNTEPVILDTRITFKSVDSEDKINIVITRNSIEIQIEEEKHIVSLGEIITEENIQNVETMLSDIFTEINTHIEQTMVISTEKKTEHLTKYLYNWAQKENENEESEFQIQNLGSEYIVKNNGKSVFSIGHDYIYFFSKELQEVDVSFDAITISHDAEVEARQAFPLEDFPINLRYSILIKTLTKFKIPIPNNL